MQLRVRAREKIGNHVGALPLRMALHEGKLRVFLIALGRETNVIELNFVCSGAGHELGQGKIIILHPGIGRIAPDQFAVLAPGLGCGFAWRDFALCSLALRVIILNNALSNLVLSAWVLRGLILLPDRTILRDLALHRLVLYSLVLRGLILYSQVLRGLILRGYVFGGFGRRRFALRNFVLRN